MKLKVTVEQVIDFELNDNNTKLKDTSKIIKRLLRENTPHICIGSFYYRLESRGSVKIISIKKGKQNVKI